MVKDLTQFNNTNMHYSKGNWYKAEDIYTACQGVDAIIVLTEWVEYSKISWKLIAEEVRFPTWVFDARSIVDKKRIVSTDLNFWRIGDGSLNI